MMTAMEGRFRDANLPRAYWGKNKTLEELGDVGKRLLSHIDEVDPDDTIRGLHVFGLGRVAIHALPLLTRALVVGGQRAYYASTNRVVLALTDNREQFEEQNFPNLLCLDHFNDADDERLPYQPEQVHRFEQFVWDHLDDGGSLFTCGCKPLTSSRWWSTRFIRRLQEAQVEMPL